MVEQQYFFLKYIQSRRRLKSSFNLKVYFINELSLNSKHHSKNTLKLIFNFYNKKKIIRRIWILNDNPGRGTCPSNQFDAVSTFSFIQVLTDNEGLSFLHAENIGSVIYSITPLGYMRSGVGCNTECLWIATRKIWFFQRVSCFDCIRTERISSEVLSHRLGKRYRWLSSQPWTW